MTSRRVQPENWEAIWSYGVALERFAKTQNPAEFTVLHLSHQSMADALKAIAMGADAQEVFRQKRTKPGRENAKQFNWTRANVYWRARAEGATLEEAVGRARSHFTIMPPPKPKSILRYARMYREQIFERFELEGLNFDELKAELSRRSRRGNWEAIPQSTTASEVSANTTAKEPAALRNIAPAASVATDNSDSESSKPPPGFNPPI